MSGVVVVDENGGSLTGAAMRGGDLVVKGRVGAHGDRPEGRHDHHRRLGRLDDRLHDAARAPDHLRRRGPGLGDSMYDGTIYVAGKVKSLGIDCVSRASGRTRTPS